MLPCRRSRLWDRIIAGSLLLAAASLIGGCDGNGTEPPIEPPPDTTPNPPPDTTPEPGPPVVMVGISGDNQTGTPHAVLPEPLVVQVQDSIGTPVPGIEVTWSTPAYPPGYAIEPAVDTTDAEGKSTVYWTLPSLVTTATAIAESVNRTEFHATVVAGPAAVFRIALDSVLVLVGDTTSAQVEATDAQGNEVPADGVVWTTTDAAIAAITDAGGIVGVSVGRTMLVATRGALADTVPVRVRSTLDVMVAPLDAGAYLTCVIDAASAVWCWGRNTGGQLGADAGGASSSNTPVQIPGLPPVVAVSGGDGHACAVTAEGVAYCWGDNNHGQLGDGTTQPRSDPVTVTGDHTWATVQAGTAHTCGLTIDGRVYCWGQGGPQMGLGFGSTFNDTYPSPTVVTGGYLALAAGGHIACGIQDDGSVACWGSNPAASIFFKNTPTVVKHDYRYTTISAGAAAGCAITEIGAGFCFGATSELGGLAATPPLAAVAAGWGGTYDPHACGMTRDGVAYCWGVDGLGKLGNGDAGSGGTAVQVATSKTFTAIAAGANHSCGLATDGDIYCWGSNRFGQLGDATSKDLANAPVKVVGGPFR